MKLSETGLTAQDIKDKVNKHMKGLTSWQRLQRISISMMKRENRIWTSMQELQLTQRVTVMRKLSKR